MLIESWCNKFPYLYQYIGHVTKNAAKKETFKYVKNVSCKAVKINLLSVPLSFTALAKGSTKKPYKCSEKK